MSTAAELSERLSALNGRRQRVLEEVLSPEIAHPLPWRRKMAADAGLAKAKAFNTEVRRALSDARMAGLAKSHPAITTVCKRLEIGAVHGLDRLYGVLGQYAQTGRLIAKVNGHPDVAPVRKSRRLSPDQRSQLAWSKVWALPEIRKVRS